MTVINTAQQKEGATGVNPYTVNYTVIESHTRREFKMGEPFDYELDCYLKDLLGGFPDRVEIF